MWTQEEFTELLHPDDAERIYTALDDLGYTVVPEEPLWQPYDGTADSGAYVQALMTQMRRTQRNG